MPKRKKRDPNKPSHYRLCKDAKAAGEVRFYHADGPCQEHNGWYYACNGVCVVCNYAKNVRRCRKYWAANRTEINRRRRARRAKVIAKRKERAKKNKWEAISKEWALKFGHEPHEYPGFDGMVTPEDL